MENKGINPGTQDKDREIYLCFKDIERRMSDSASEFGGLEAFFSPETLEPYYRCCREENLMDKDSSRKELDSEKDSARDD